MLHKVCNVQTVICQAKLSTVVLQTVASHALMLAGEHLSRSTDPECYTELLFYKIVHIICNATLAGTEYVVWSTCSQTLQFWPCDNFLLLDFILCVFEF